jgi:hypothetical protein
VWKKIDNETIVLVGEPTTHESRPGFGGRLSGGSQRPAGAKRERRAAHMESRPSDPNVANRPSMMTPRASRMSESAGFRSTGRNQADGYKIRAKVSLAVKIKSVADTGFSKVTFVTQFAYGGLMPAFVMTTELKEALDEARLMQTYFQELRTDYDADDARILGLQFVYVCLLSLSHSA